MQAYSSRLGSKAIIFLFIFGLLLALFGVQLFSRETRKESGVFIGVDIGYGDEKDVYLIVDEISGHSNLIVLGSLKVTTDTAKLTRVCDYLYERGFYFIIYVAFADRGYSPPRGPDPQFFSRAVNRWKHKFLGAYVFDEPGGKLMDGAHSINVTIADSYSEAAMLYTRHLNFFLSNVTQYYKPANLTVFSSDYALYWYDYVSGYDIVLGEFVGNQSREVTVALCRGAAKTLNKDWGIMITWAYPGVPFLEDAGQLFLDMVLAYENGAKYLVIFDSPGEFPATTEFGTLTHAHLEAIKMFWNYVTSAPEAEEYPSTTAYVLPRDYGYGFRSSKDKIWGLWDSDTLSSVVWNDTLNEMALSALTLDVVYETKIGDEPIRLPYDKIIFWNGSKIEK